MNTRPAFEVRRFAREPLVVLWISPNRILAFLAVLALVLTSYLGSLAALLFLVSSFLLWVRHPTQALNELFRFWPFFLLPLWCVMTLFWSRDPSITMRYGLQLGFTCVVAVAMAARLSPRDFLWALFSVHAIAATLSLAMPNATGEAGAWLGIFGSKNEFSATMGNLVLISLAFVLDRGTKGSRRWLAFAAALLGLFLLVMGRSTGALATTLLAVTVGLLLAGLRRVPVGGRLLFVALALMGIGAAGLVAWGLRAEIADAFLDATGKDMTLTGRTDLWAAAFHEISQHRLLGQGFQAFWIPGNAVAEAMWAKFGIQSKSGFHFHSTWISNAVEIGIIGIGLQAAAFLTTLVLAWRWALLSPSAPSIYFTIFMSQLTVLSFIEVVAYSQFSMNTVIVITALVYGLRFRAEGRARRGPAPRRLS